MGVAKDEMDTLPDAANKQAVNKVLGVIPLEHIGSSIEMYLHMLVFLAILHFGDKQQVRKDINAALELEVVG